MAACVRSRPLPVLFVWGMWAVTHKAVVTVSLFQICFICFTFIFVEHIFCFFICPLHLLLFCRLNGQFNKTEKKTRFRVHDNLMIKGVCW